MPNLNRPTWRLCLCRCSGEPMCIAFNKLPPKKEYPDYYVEIKKPIALDIIKGKITRGVYGTVAEFVADIDLMCDNAQTYNIPDSYIYDVAGDIRRAGALSKNDADTALDELFQAIYDADLGKAVKLLDIANLPIDDYRPVHLVEQGADEGDGGEYQWAPLHAAACYGRLKVAQLLCRRGAKVEAVDTMHKSTPLAWAAYTNRKRLAKFLVREFNANVNARNAHDQLPIQIAVDPGHPMWSEFLLPTDGTVVDLPPPEVHEPPPDLRRTPTKKGKSRSQDAPTGEALPGMPLGSPAGAGSASVFEQLRQQQQHHLAQLAGAQLQSFTSPQRQTAPMPANGPAIPQCIGGIGHKETEHPQMHDAMREIVAQLEELPD
ncbi:hypothetical protein IWQ57_004508, partial [Coemansia nantahalensis]